VRAMARGIRWHTAPPPALKAYCAPENRRRHAKSGGTAHPGLAGGSALRRDGLTRIWPRLQLRGASAGLSTDASLESSARRDFRPLRGDRRNLRRRRARDHGRGGVAGAPTFPLARLEPATAATAAASPTDASAGRDRRHRDRSPGRAATADQLSGCRRLRAPRPRGRRRIVLRETQIPAAIAA